MGDRSERIHGHDTIDVRPIEAGEWRLLKTIRLAALADAPGAFITTLAEATTFPDELWRDRAALGATSESQRTVLAVRGATALGIAVGLDRGDVAPGVVAVVSVYVAPEARRHGVAGRLMAGVETWAAQKGAHHTSLWVVEGNDAAEAFYTSIGYRLTLDRQRISVPPVRWERRMTKRLIPD